MSLGRSAGGPPGGLPGCNGGGAWWRPGGFSLGMPGRVVRAVARGALDDLVATVFPGECRVCDGPLLRAGVAPVCEACVARVLPQRGLLCGVCGEAMGMEDERFAEGFGREAPRCTPCRRVPPEFARAVAYGVYEGELREMLHLLKYERMRSLAGPLGRMLVSALEPVGGELEQGEWLVVAVPLFRAKERGRGFNHAELLADAAMRWVEIHGPAWRMRAAHGCLQRVRETESQFGLTPQGRRKNVRGAFAVVDPARVAGRDVLVIDDIYTTGATARACAQMLRRAGARRVLVGTLARAQVERVAMWTGGRQAGGSLGAGNLGTGIREPAARNVERGRTAAWDVMGGDR